MPSNHRPMHLHTQLKTASCRHTALCDTHQPMGFFLPQTGQWLCLRSDDCNSPFFVHLALVATAQHPQPFPSPSTIKLPCPSHLWEHFFVMDSGCLFFFLSFANILNKTSIVFVSPLARSGMVWVSSVPQSSFSISSVIFRASFCKYEGL